MRRPWQDFYAQTLNLPVLDLFSPINVLARNAWIDDYHFQPEVFLMLAKLVAGSISSRFAEKHLQQRITLTGPDGTLK